VAQCSLGGGKLTIDQAFEMLRPKPAAGQSVEDQLKAAGELAAMPPADPWE
jgi:hypothetical protein